MRTITFFFLVLLTACQVSLPDGVKVEKIPTIFPDYVDVTIPSNIAPLNFKLVDSDEDIYVQFKTSHDELIVEGSKGKIKISEKKWASMLKQAAGSDIETTVYSKEGGEWTVFQSFYIHVAKELMDSHIAYRLIEPGYELWNQMGIYQRNLENFKQTAIMENKMTGSNCMNCHSFCMQNPDKMLFHMRETYPCTILIDGDKVEKLITKTEQTISNLVYPSWHPGGRYIAFSVNSTKQAFHMNDRNRVEVFDEASDVVVYDSENHEIITSPVIFSKESWETFPTFSPDGKTLFFCSAEPRAITDFKEIKYNLCSISFDPENRKFGTTVDTLYNASLDGRSASFPRVSPDGKFLLYTLSGYGNFSIWHKDADLYMVDLKEGTTKVMQAMNSNDVESYHSWSSNSRWVVFSSRRIDGLYTRPFFAHVDKNGNAGKPFLLPQKDPDFYLGLMKSYNIPEFITGAVKSQSYSIAEKAKKDAGIQVRFSSI